MALIPPDFLIPLLGAPVAVLGGGVSGAGAAALIQAWGRTATTYDARGTPFAANVGGHRLVVYSPGFAPEHPWLAQARAAGALCLPELDLAARAWRGRVVAVTGTNGKTTLTEFLVHALTTAGQRAYAAGNIGHSFSQLVVDTHGGDPAAIAVCEVSSFQAETLSYFQAEATLWTNFAEDHLERHGTMAAYFNAKAALAPRSQRLWAGSSVLRYAERLGRLNLERCEWIATEQQASDHALAGTAFAEYPQRENFILAAAWWRAQGLPPAVLAEAARTFRVGRHRLARVAERGGVVFWNDSKATNFHAAEAALQRLAGPVHLIAGGKSKGGDLPGFAARAAPYVRHAYLIGETREALAQAFAAAGVEVTLCDSLAAAVEAAASAAGPGDQVLLSPGFASFDQFRNYEDRGDQFENLVREWASGARPLVT